MALLLSGSAAKALDISEASRGNSRGPRRRGERSWALRPQERLAALMGGRGQVLLCEELILRARLDLDQGRHAQAAVELERGMTSAVAELRREGRQDLLLRIAELEQLLPGVAGQADLAIEGSAEPLYEELLAHAVGRAEAALRARTATGV